MQTGDERHLASGTQVATGSAATRQPGVYQGAQHGDPEDLADLARGIVHGRGHPGPLGGDRRHGDRAARSSGHAHARADAAFIGLAALPPAGIATHLIADEPLVAVVHPQDPLATETSVPLAALAGRPLISLQPGAGLRAALEAACAAAGFTPRVAIEAADPRVLAELAAQGLGAAIVPRSVADARAGQVHTVTLTEPEPRGRLALAWRAEGPVSPAAREFIARVRRADASG